MLKRIAVAAAMVALSSATVFADVIKDDYLSIDAIAYDGVAPRGTGSVPYSTGFESSQGFSPGLLTQAGWQTAVGDLRPIVATANPFAGSQHMRFNDDPNSAAGSFGATLGFSPNYGNTNRATKMSVMVNISNVNGADYFINPQSNTQAMSCTRVDFYFGDTTGANDPDTTLGEIRVISDPDGPGPLAAAFLATGVEYTPGVYKELRIETVSNGLYNYFYGGVLIAGPLFGFHNAGGTPCLGGWEEDVFADDQFQLTNEAGDFDNYLAVPEPAALALLAIGGLFVARRRRNA